MKEERTVYPINKYDEWHDVLHVYLNNRCNEYDASAEEEYSDIYVLKDDDTDEISVSKFSISQKPLVKSRKCIHSTILKLNKKSPSSRGKFLRRKIWRR